MPKITFVSHDGTEETVDVRSGLSLMEAAVGEGVEGIEAECGGACNCATCHVYLDPQWIERLPPPKTQERELLEERPGTNENSRLSCQIVLVPEMDGMTVNLPETQQW